MRTLIRSFAVIGCVLFFVGVVLNLPRRPSDGVTQRDRAVRANSRTADSPAPASDGDSVGEPTPAKSGASASDARREAASRLRPADAGVSLATPDDSALGDRSADVASPNNLGPLTASDPGPDGVEPASNEDKSRDNSSGASALPRGGSSKPAGGRGVGRPTTAQTERAAVRAGAGADEPPGDAAQAETSSPVALESGASDAGAATSPPGLDGDPTRQFRVPGQSPHLLLAIVEDLSREDLGCYGARWLKSPRMNEIAEQGLRHTRLAGSASGQSVERTALWFGELPPTPPEGKLQRLPRTSLPEMLWQAGFAPTLLGDCSWAGGGGAGQGGWHRSYGWDEQEGTKFDTYPRAVLRDGRAEPVTDNAEFEATRFERLLFDEAKRALVEHEETHRPVALVVTLRLKWWRDAKYVNVAFEHENWTAAEKEHASAILAVDRLIGEIGRQVEKSIGARRTIIAVVGLPREKPSPELTRFAGASIEKETALSGKQRWPYAPLIVRWPGRIQAGSVMTSFCGFQDLLPTFGEMVQARQTPRDIHGVTQWREWSRSAVFPRAVELQPSPE